MAYADSLLQPANPDTLRRSHQEEASNRLDRRYNNAVTKQKRDFHSHQRVPHLT